MTLTYATYGVIITWVFLLVFWVGPEPFRFAAMVGAGISLLLQIISFIGQLMGKDSWI